jgi:hypothetical protein
LQSVTRAAGGFLLLRAAGGAQRIGGAMGLVRSDPVERALRELSREAPRTIADALNRVAFEVLDEEEREVRSSFSFAGPSTERFLARSFFFDRATGSNLVATVRAKPKGNALLLGHVRGDTVEPDKRRLTFGEGAEEQIAAPVRANVKRGARGKVPARLAPEAVTDPEKRGRGFRAGRAILQRIGKGRDAVRVLYALASRIRLRPRFDHIEAARRTMIREFPAKARRAIQKAAERARTARGGRR